MRGVAFSIEAGVGVEAGNGA